MTALLLVFVLALTTLALAGRDFYKILNVQRDATARQIKRAYRMAAQKWHPDKNKEKGAEEKFTEISEAYEVLNNEEKRRIYDTEGEEGLKADAQGGGGGDPFDIFSSFFGGGGGRRRGRGGRQQKQQMPALHIELPVTLRDLYNGRTFRMMHKKTVLCPKCRGTGSDDPNDVKKCPKCKGSGITMTTRQLGPGFVQQMQSECTRCKGTGKIIKTKCTQCHGTKLQHGHEEEMIVVVEEGMANGEQITLEQEGDENPDYTPADIVVHLKTVADPELIRNGNDLHAQLTIPIRQALLGVNTVFKHLDDREISVERDGITPHGFVMQVTGEGMPVHNFPSERGDLFIEFQVQFPHQLTTEQRQLVDKLFPKQ